MTTAGGEGEVMVPVDVYPGLVGVGSCMTGGSRATVRLGGSSGAVLRELVAVENTAASVGLTRDASAVFVCAKASSARALVTRSLSRPVAREAGDSEKGNEEPLVWAIEKSSRDGNFADSWSTAPARTCIDVESSAANGSPLVTVGLGLS